MSNVIAIGSLVSDIWLATERWTETDRQTQTNEKEKEGGELAYPPRVLNVDADVIGSTSGGVDGQGGHLGPLGLRGRDRARGGGVDARGMQTDHHQAAAVTTMSVNHNDNNNNNNNNIHNNNNNNNNMNNNNNNNCSSRARYPSNTGLNVLYKQRNPPIETML